MHFINYKKNVQCLFKLPGLHHIPSETIIGSDLPFQIQHHAEKKKITRELMKNNVQKSRSLDLSTPM